MRHSFEYPKQYVVDTQKNYLNEMVLFSTYKYVKTDEQGNIHNFTLKKCAYLKLWILSIYKVIIIFKISNVYLQIISSGRKMVITGGHSDSK